MSFDINEVVANMVDTIKTTVADNWPLVKETANDFLQDRKSRLELLASLRLQSQISDEFFLQRLQDEKDILTSELHSIAIITKAIAQKAANAAIDVLQNAVSSFIRFHCNYKEDFFRCITIPAFPGHSYICKFF